MARVLLFAAMREVVGARQIELQAGTVADVVDQLSARHGAAFDKLLPYCNIMVGAEKASRDTAVTADDEVAIMPPVSGG